MTDLGPPGWRPPRPPRSGRRSRSGPPPTLRPSRLWEMVPDEVPARRSAPPGRRLPRGRPLGARARPIAPGGRRRPAPAWWERLGSDAAAELDRRRDARREARRDARRTFRRVRASAPQPVGLLVWWSEQALLLRRAALVGFAALVTALVVLALPLFHLQRVTVVGAGALSTRSVVAASGLTRGESMLFVGAGTVERGVLQLPGVRAASVRVVWPDRVAIALQMWTPILVDVRAGLAAPVAPNGEALAAGRPLAALGSALVGLPRVVELGRAAPIHAGAPVLTGRYAQVLAALVQVFPRTYGVTVREFAVSPAGSLLVYVSSGWVADFGPVLTPGQLRGLGPRLEALRTLATRVDLAHAGIAAIDLQDPSQVDVTDGRPASPPLGGPPVLRASPAGG